MRYGLMDQARPLAEPPLQDDLSSALRRNFEALERRRKRERSEAPWSDRLAKVITGFTGSMTLVAIHLLLYRCSIARPSRFIHRTASSRRGSRKWNH